MKLTLKRREVSIVLVAGIVLLFLWLLGLGTSHTLGGFIYVVLVVGIILVVVALVARYRRHR
jgi:hypothetical protein